MIDILPTLADLAGVTYPDSWHGKQLIPVEGRSLLPVLKGETHEDHKSLYWYGPHNGAGAIRQGPWKLVSEGEGQTWELYDMVADRTETNDLAGKLPDRTARMCESWFTWASRMGYSGRMPPSETEQEVLSP